VSSPMSISNAPSFALRMKFPSFTVRTATITYPREPASTFSPPFAFSTGFKIDSRRLDPPPAAITGDHGVCQDCQVRLALCRDAEISRYRIRSTTISDEISRYSGAARKTNRAHALDIKTDWMLKCAEASKVHSHAHKPPSQRMDWTGKGGGRRRAKGADGAQPHVATFVHLRASRARHADRAQASVFLSFCSLCRGFEKSKARKREPCRHVLAALAIARSVRLTRFD